MFRKIFDNHKYAAKLNSYNYSNIHKQAMYKIYTAFPLKLRYNYQFSHSNGYSLHLLNSNMFTNNLDFISEVIAREVTLSLTDAELEGIFLLDKKDIIKATKNFWQRLKTTGTKS